MKLILHCNGVRGLRFPVVAACRQSGFSDASFLLLFFPIVSIFKRHRLTDGLSKVEQGKEVKENQEKGSSEWFTAIKHLASLFTLSPLNSLPACLCTVNHIPLLPCSPLYPKGKGLEAENRI